MTPLRRHDCRTPGSSQPTWGTRAWVYQHAAELGALRIGYGPRARLRFDLETVIARLGALDGDTVTASLSRPPRAPSPAERPGRNPSSSSTLLPITPRRVRGIR